MRQSFTLTWIWSRLAKGKLLHDVTGHYQRFDVFSLHVNRQAYGPNLAGPGAEEQTGPLEGSPESEADSDVLVQDPDLVQT